MLEAVHEELVGIGGLRAVREATGGRGGRCVADRVIDHPGARPGPAYRPIPAAIAEAIDPGSIFCAMTSFSNYVEKSVEF